MPVLPETARATPSLPTPEEALDKPLKAFPSWFLRIECERCGAMRMISERHGALTIREIIAHRRPHTDCGGQPGWVALVTGSSIPNGPVRRIVLRAG
jgi:hypothetical protein